MLGQRTTTTFMLCFFGVLVSCSDKPSVEVATNLYGLDSRSTVNRLHSALFIRKGPDDSFHGEDTVDPLYWASTRYLINGKSHAKAIHALDAFLADRYSVSKLDAVQRALLQNDLWRLFNWTIQVERFTESVSRIGLTKEQQEERQQAGALMSRLARAIRRLALSEEEITTLPDNLSLQADTDAPEDQRLPSFDNIASSWVRLHRKDYRAVAPTHVRAFEGRSSFAVYLRLPQGRQQTLDYLHRLNAVAEPVTYDRNKAAFSGHSSPPWLKSDLPQFPQGTEVALVRRLVVWSDEGQPRATNIVQTVQIRKFEKVPDTPGSNPEDQKFREFFLKRKELFSGNARTLELAPMNKRDFSHFLVHQEDQLDAAFPANKIASGEWKSSVYTCFSCHNSPGIFSLNSYVGGFSDTNNRAPQFQDDESKPVYEDPVQYNHSSYERGVLRQWLREESDKNR